MALIDEVKINIQAGKGGDGQAAFSKKPGIKGATGGDGGRGGNVFLEGVSDLSKLKDFRFSKDFAAQDGETGGRTNRQSGVSGKDLILKIPVGTIASIEEASKSVEITEVGQKALVAKGGRGGRGNYNFVNAERRSPKVAEKGRRGEKFTVKLELKLIADIGFIGLPSAGKSSLLNAFTRAQAKVAAYPFTTLEPNLGVLEIYGKSYILADIPGLIQGAAQGKGIGIKFLRHIQRTRYLFHCISAESRDVIADYKTIREELANYDPSLSQKPECLILTKTDLREEKDWVAAFDKLEKINPCIVASSIHEADSVEKVKSFIANKLQKKEE